MCISLVSDPILPAVSVERTSTVKFVPSAGGPQPLRVFIITPLALTSHVPVLIRASIVPSLTVNVSDSVPSAFPAGGPVIVTVGGVLSAITETAEDPAPRPYSPQGHSPSRRPRVIPTVPSPVILVSVTVHTVGPRLPLLLPLAPPVGLSVISAAAREPY